MATQCRESKKRPKYNLKKLGIFLAVLVLTGGGGRLSAWSSHHTAQDGDCH